MPNNDDEYYTLFRTWFVTEMLPRLSDKDLWGFLSPVIIRRFKEEYGEKKRKKAVKEVLEKYIQEILIETETGDKIIISLTADDCYNELKEKGMLK